MTIIRQLPHAISLALAVLVLTAVTSEMPAGSSPHASISQVERVDLETDIPSYYRIVDLGAFGSPGSQAYSAAYGLNERGDVVGVAEDDDWVGTPFLYRKGELIDIGSINLEYRSGTAKAVNARGQIAGRSIGWSPYPKFPTWVNRPFLATPRGSVVDAAPGIGIDGEAFGINNRGQMAVTLNLVPTIRAIPRAHFWDPKTGLHEIKFPSQPEGAEDSSAAWAINQRGQVVGSFEGEDLAPHAYIWNSHTNEVVDLHLSSAVASGAYAINNRGDVAGWFEGQGLHYVIIWTHDGRIVSPPALLDPTLPSGTAEGINNRGDVVGWYANEQDLDPLAWVLFDAVDGEFPNGYPESIALADLLEESDRAEWELWYAQGINDARQIVGLGLHNGLIRGFLMTPECVDIEAPAVEFLDVSLPLDGLVELPMSLGLDLVFRSSDEYYGGITHEAITIDGCTAYDGNTYGDGDGLLSDEKLEISPRELRRVVDACGFQSFRIPEIRVQVTDCGGSVASDVLTLPFNVRVADTDGDGAGDALESVPRRVSTPRISATAAGDGS